MRGQRNLDSFTPQDSVFDYSRPFVLLAILLLISCSTPESSSKKDPKESRTLRIHMISGSKEYKSAESLSSWKQRLESRYSVECVISLGTDRTKTIRGLEKLSEADLLVLFNRRFELKEKCWNPIERYLKSDRPVLGIRTASHAFDRNFPNIDQQLLGANYHGHGPPGDVRVIRSEAHQDHPILTGITGWKRKGKLYKNNQFADSTKILLTGEGKGMSQPVAWINRRNGQRVFYTSMGFPHDFKNKQFLRLLKNAIEWTTERSLRK